jgi:hypothetical protein
VASSAQRKIGTNFGMLLTLLRLPREPNHPLSGLRKRLFMAADGCK